MLGMRKKSLYILAIYMAKIIQTLNINLTKDCCRKKSVGWGSRGSVSVRV